MKDILMARYVDGWVLGDDVGTVKGAKVGNADGIADGCIVGSPMAYQMVA